MRRRSLPFAFLLGLASLAWLGAQGPLNPSKGPTPGMKTLDQVEPRTDLATVPGNASAMHVITQSGSYNLSGNLDVTTTDGIDAEYNVTNSYGQTSGDDGIQANVISYSRGRTTGSGVGLRCAIAVGCTSSGGEAITNKYLMP